MTVPIEQTRPEGGEEMEEGRRERERGRRWRGDGSLMENMSYTYTYKASMLTHMQHSDCCYGSELSLVSDWVCSG